MNKKVIYTISIIVAILLVIFGVYKLSSVLVNKSFDSRKIVEEKETKEIENVTDEKVFDGTGNKDGLSKVACVYNEKDLEKDTENFFRDQNRQYLSEAIEKAKVSSDKYYKQIKDLDKTISDESIYDFDLEDSGVITKELLEEKDYIRFSSSLTIVNMYDKTKVILCHNLNETGRLQLILFDYVDSLFNIESSKALRVGEESNILLTKGYYVFESFDNYDIIYAKGVEE